jgi:hypothetical protein
MNNTEPVRCPELVGIDVAEELLAEYRHLHEDPQFADEYLRLLRRVAVRVHELLPCEPVKGESGRLICSLEGVVGGAMRMALIAKRQDSKWVVSSLDESARPRDVVGQML